jgi:hypothetical protein
VKPSNIATLYPGGRAPTRACPARERAYSHDVADDRQGDIGIDWATAAVDDGRLTVGFSGKPSSEWTDRLERVIGRLRRPTGGWRDIAVRRKTVRVDSVSPGSESDLRHFLESAVLQTNADLAPDEGDDEDSGTERSGADQRMTDAFRSFSAEDEEED